MVRKTLGEKTLIEKTLDVCPFCKAELELVKGRKLFDFGNPGKVIIDCSRYKCPRCGEEFLDERQSLSVSKQLDKAFEKKKKIKVPTGSIVV